VGSGTSSEARRVRDDQIALQLYTVRRDLASDLEGTLRAVAEAGYTAVEVAGLPPVDPARLAGLLEDNGLRVAAAHESLDALRTEAAAVLERLTSLGCPRVVVPFLAEADRATVADTRRTAAELATIAGTVGDHGLRLAYHNHNFEFAPLDGTTVWDVLLDELPADRVDIELDVFWAAYAGEDPVARIRALAGRVRLLHMKDLGDDRRDYPPGEGSLPFEAIVAAGREAGVEWYIVEQDEPRDALNDIVRGLRHLEGLAAAPAGA
jgi:sugar phosphate isomerase/epimerase